MDCAAVKPRMEALVSGSLPASERSLAEQHIAICEGCRLELELVRAIGSQEKAPAVGKDDWTLDRIFGSDGAQGGGPQGGAGGPGGDDISGASSPGTTGTAGSTSIFPGGDADPPSAPASPPEPAAAKSDTDSSAGEEERKAPGASGSWDFEPADAQSQVNPPMESLFFATEALTRSKSSGKKSSKLRVILWGAGGLVGAALLAFSSWFVLHMSSPDSGDSPAGSHSKPSAGVPDGSPSQGSPEETPEPGTVQPPANDGGGTPDPDAPDNSAHNAPTAREPGVAASSAVPRPASALGTSAGTGPAKPAPSTASPQPQKGSLSADTQGTNPRVTTTPPRPTVPTPRTSESTEHRAEGEQARPMPRPYTPPPDDEPEVEESRARSRATPSPEAPKSEPAIDSESGASDQPGAETSPAPAAKTVKVTAPTTGRSDSMWRPVDPKPSPEKPQTVEINAPIDRLHLASVEAEERGDVVTLRRLRSSWKSFMVKIIGPDRARAKREYADCLWAIQNLTGRRSDQKETLAAYREYLLGAPAGGADSRSVSRLRQLEDALAEHQ